MKLKLIILGLSIVLAIAVNGQIVAGLEGGLSLNKTLAFGVHGGYKFDKINVLGGLQTHLSNKVENGASFQIRGGYELKITEGITLMPNAGFAYNLKTIDKKEKNESAIVTGIQVNKYFEFKGDQGRVYLSATYTKGWHFLTIGCAGLFGGNSYE